MATWRAKCWLGSASGYQELEVESNTSYGAKEQFQRIYGAEQIINLRQVSGGSSSSSDYSGWGPIIIFLFVLGLVIQYWYIVLPISIILGILIWIGLHAED